MTIADCIISYEKKRIRCCLERQPQKKCANEVMESPSDKSAQTLNPPQRFSITAYKSGVW